MYGSIVEENYLFQVNNITWLHQQRGRENATAVTNNVSQSLRGRREKKKKLTHKSNINVRSEKYNNNKAHNEFTDEQRESNGEINICLLLLLLSQTGIDRFEHAAIEKIVTNSLN